MKELETLNKDVEEYFKFKKYCKMLSERLDVLNEKIKHQLIKHAAAGAKEAALAENIDYTGCKGYKVELRVKTKEKQPDEAEVSQLFYEKGLYDVYAETYLPDSALEQAYLNGDLTDNDLRKLRQKPDRYLSLHIEEVDKDV